MATPLTSGGHSARDDREQFSPNNKKVIAAALLASAVLPGVPGETLSAEIIAARPAAAASDDFSGATLPSGERDVIQSMSVPRRGVQKPSHNSRNRSSSSASTWQQNSKALKMHNAIQEKIRMGREVKPQEIEALFRQIDSERSTKVSAAFVRSYAARFRDDASSIALLNYLDKAEHLTGSAEFLQPYYQYENPRVVVAALRVAAENTGIRIDLNFLAPFQQHESSAVRAQALSMGLQRQLPVTSGNPIDIARAAEGISSKDMLHGFQLRYGLLMGHALENLPGQTHRREDLRAIQMPVMRTLREIDEAYPGYLDTLDKNTPEVRAAFMHLLAEIVMEQRAELSQRVIFGKDVKLLSILHEESCFSRARILEFTGRFGVEDITILKGVNKQSPKAAYLEDVREIAADREQEAVIWNCGHGGPQHFWLRAGQAGVHVSDKLRDPRAISYLELAEALVLPQVVQVKHGNAAAIDLSHVTLIYDACFQYNMAENFYRAVYALAAEHKVEVSALPLLVTASQDSMYGWVYKGDVNRSFLQQALHELQPAEEGVFRVADLFATDQKLSEAYLAKLGERASYTEVQSGEDLAIFSGKLMHTSTLLGQVFLRGLERGVDFGEFPQIDDADLDARHRVPEIGKRS